MISQFHVSIMPRWTFDKTSTRTIIQQLRRMWSLSIKICGIWENYVMKVTRNIDFSSTSPWSLWMNLTHRGFSTFSENYYLLTMIQLVLQTKHNICQKKRNNLCFTNQTNVLNGCKFIQSNVEICWEIMRHWRLFSDTCIPNLHIEHSSWISVLSC